jgi:hypothetical protein
MNPTDYPCFPAGAHDALFDQIEGQLRALTTAPLDTRAVLPRRCVDEFANEFLSHFSMPLRRRCQNSS